MELEKLKQILASLMSVDIAELSEHTRFLEDLGMDSLDVFQLVIEAEEYFGVIIPERSYGSLKTAGNAADLIKTLV